MKLTLYTDHALRVLMHLASTTERLSSISEIARLHQISHNHLMKVVHQLRKDGLVDAVRGRRGGIRLARPAQEITLGAVVRHTERFLDLVDWEQHVSTPPCSPSDVIQEALLAFMATLDRYTLADLVEPSRSQNF